MTTTTELLPRCAVPCPSWCACPAGHPYESDDSDGNGIRYHELEIGKTTSPDRPRSRAKVTITAEAIEAGDSERVDPAVVQVHGETFDGAVGGLSALDARELADLLVEAADRLAGILAQETAR